MDALTPEKLAYGARVVEFSAHGSKVVIASREYNVEQSSDKIDLILYDLESRSTMQLTRAAWGTRSLHPALFSSNSFDSSRPDFVAFLRAGKLHLLPLTGGESYEASSESLPIQSFKIFRDAHQQLHAIFEMEVYAGLTPAETLARDAELKADGSAILFDKLMVRHWNNWNTFGKRNHLFIKALQDESDGTLRLANDSPAIDILFGLETDCSGKGPIGQGSADYTISSDGKWVAMACRKFDSDSGAQPSDFAWTTDVPIYLASLQHLIPNQALPWKQISNPDLRVYNFVPSFSSNSDYLVFVSTTREGYESDRSRITLYHLKTETLITLTEDIDLAFGSVKWDPDSDHVLYATAGFRGSNRLFRLTLNEDFDALLTIEVMDGDESRTDFDIASFEEGNLKALIYAESTILSPSEIKRADLLVDDAVVEDPLFVPFDPIPITNENAHEFTGVHFIDQPQRLETIWCPFPAASNGDLNMPSLTQHYFLGANDEPVQCWYLTPPSIAEKALIAAKSVPLLVIVHGGPQSAMLNAWNYRWNLSAFASGEYAVVAVNFHGSSSFGEAFCDSINRDWGGKPYEDIMRGLDFVLQTYPYLNPDRVAALGASYGGYMMNWINGHTDRFRCLVNHAGIFSLRSLYFNTEELFFPGTLCLSLNLH